jgi:tRNA pseudouridine38-40 synthase
MRLLATVEYDGTDFAGFQLQAHGPAWPGRPQRTVQAVLEESVAPLAGAGTRIFGAGRTDAGVHAAGQVIHFDTIAPLAHDLPRFLRAWNASLPFDVRVQTIAPVPPDVHARYSARARSYGYRIVNAPFCSPLLRRYAHHLRAPLDVGAMAEGASHLVGAHDFRPFAAGEGPGQTRRLVMRATVTEQWADPPLIWHTFEQLVAQPPSDFCGPGDPPSQMVSAATPLAPVATRVVLVEVEANAFLRHMMRRIVGTLVEVGQGSRPPVEVAAILAAGGARGKERVGPTVPARGLCLQYVRYDPDAPGYPWETPGRDRSTSTK